MRYAILFCAVLAGCAGLVPPPMTPEERAAYFQMVQQQQQQQQQAQQRMIDAYSRRPAVSAPSQPIHCTSTTNMGVTNTNCY